MDTVFAAFDDILADESALYVVRNERVDAPYTFICERGTSTNILHVLSVVSRLMSTVRLLDVQAALNGASRIALHFAVDVGAIHLAGIESLSTVVFFQWGNALQQTREMIEYMAEKNMAPETELAAVCCVTPAIAMACQAVDLDLSQHYRLHRVPNSSSVRCARRGKVLCSFLFAGTSGMESVPRKTEDHETEEEVGTSTNNNDRHDEECNTEDSDWKLPHYDLAAFHRICNKRFLFRGSLEPDYQQYMVGEWFALQIVLMAIYFAIFVLGTFSDLTVPIDDSALRLHLALGRLLVSVPVMIILATYIWVVGVQPNTPDGMTPIRLHQVCTVFYLVPIIHLLVVVEVVPGNAGVFFAAAAISAFVSTTSAPLVRCYDTVFTSVAGLLVVFAVILAGSPISDHTYWVPANVIACVMVAYGVDRESRVRYLWCLWTRFALMKLIAVRNKSQRKLNMARGFALVDATSEEDACVPVPSPRAATLCPADQLNVQSPRCSSTNSSVCAPSKFDNVAVLVVHLGLFEGTESDVRMLEVIVDACDLLSARYACQMLPPSDNTVIIASQIAPSPDQLPDVMLNLVECAMSLRDVAMRMRPSADNLAMMLHTGFTMSSAEVDADVMKVAFEAVDLLAPLAERHDARYADGKALAPRRPKGDFSHHPLAC